MCAARCPAAYVPPTYDLAHGEKEVRAVLEDRPQLNLVLRPGDAVWQRLVSGFAVSTQGTVVAWDSHSTSAINLYGAESLYPEDSHTIIIRVDGVEKAGPLLGQLRPPEEVLAGLVFELNNVPNRDATVQINYLAEIGHITRQNFVMSLAHLEYNTSRQVERFFRETWQPYCQARHIAYRPELWSYGSDATFDDWLASIPPQSGYPWLAYGAAYDQILNTRSLPRR
jgi:hypothetical protein